MNRTQLYELAVATGKILVAENSPIALDAAISKAALENKIVADFGDFKNYVLGAKTTYSRLAFQKLPSELNAAKPATTAPEKKTVAASSPEAHGATNIESAKGDPSPQ